MPTAYNAPIPYNSHVTYNGHSLSGSSARVTNPAQLLIVDRAGVPSYELEQATVDSATRELWTSESSVGSLDFTIPTRDPKLSAVGEAILLEHEVQLWYEDQLWWWGIPVTIPEANRTTCRIGCVGLPWWYHQRIFGPIEVNLLTDPSFEDPALAAWTAVNCTKESVTSPVALGTRAMRLSAPTNPDAYARQRITVTAGPAQAVRYFPAAHFYVDTSSVPFSGVALEERGVYIEQQNATTGVLIGTPVFYPIPLSTPPNTWVRIEVEDGIEVPAGATERLEYRLYDPTAAIVWDAASLTTQGSVATVPGGEDASVLIGKVNAYFQDVAQGKSALNIGFSGALTGKTVDRSYQYKDVPGIGASLNQYPAEGVCDLAVMWAADGRSRWLQVFPGQKGSLRDDLAIELAHDGLGDFSWSLDARQTRTAVHAMGQGQGSDREVAVSRDTSLLGGLILESPIFAPPETQVGGLAPLAATELARLRKRVRLPSVSVAAAGYLGLTEGDTVPVWLDWGIAKSLGDVHRVQRLTLRPQQRALEIGFANG